MQSIAELPIAINSNTWDKKVMYSNWRGRRIFDADDEFDKLETSYYAHHAPVMR